ncbi:Protein YLS9 [Carex littledalei]|uniref:Protein YLS9 n=1 Tax=Carex littledalei TaxID=544730 RepID=A0A833V777_9POAL|nr:Protein YLS9 [Carex littledalei]
MSDSTPTSIGTTKTNQVTPLAPLSSNQSSYPVTPVHTIQIPREYVMKSPPEANFAKYASYSRIQMRQRVFRRCHRSLCAGVCLLILTIIVIMTIVYFIYRPKAPTYALTALTISGFEPLSSSALTPLSPSITASLQTGNPNKRISILYQTGGSVSAYYDTVHLCQGEWPAFRQPPRNVTVFKMDLTGSGVLLTSVDRSAILKDVDVNKVPLTVKAKVPVKIKFGMVTSWPILVRLSCDVIVDSLNGTATVLSRACHVDTHYLW